MDELILIYRMYIECIKQPSIVNVDFFIEWHLYYTDSAIFDLADFFGKNRHNLGQLSSNNQQFKNWSNWTILISGTILVPGFEVYLSKGYVNIGILKALQPMKFTQNRNGQK